MPVLSTSRFSGPSARRQGIWTASVFCRRHRVCIIRHRPVHNVNRPRSESCNNALLTSLRLSPVVERPYRVAILWGGSRGAVTLSLALAVTESFLVPIEVKRPVAILATGFTLFTLLVQGTTLRWVIGKLGLDKLSPLDNALYNQVIAVALQTVREDLSKVTENYDLTKETVRAEAKRFGEGLDIAVKSAEENADILDRDRITLGLIALASAERDSILARFRDRTISAALSERLVSEADALIEGARLQAAPETRVRRDAVSALAAGCARRFFSTTVCAFQRRWPRLTASRFGLLLSQRLILAIVSLTRWKASISDGFYPER